MDPFCNQLDYHYEGSPHLGKLVPVATWHQLGLMRAQFHSVLAERPPRLLTRPLMTRFFIYIPDIMLMVYRYHTEMMSCGTVVAIRPIIAVFMHPIMPSVWGDDAIDTDTRHDM